MIKVIALAASFEVRLSLTLEVNNFLFILVNKILIIGQLSARMVVVVNELDQLTSLLLISNVLYLGTYSQFEKFRILKMLVCVYQVLIQIH